MKILIVTPYSRDANSFWRCMGPMAYLAKHSGGQIQIHLPPEDQPMAWDRVAEYDLVFMHRPCRPDDLTILQIARNLNIPVWVDYDDWLFHLPEWNPSIHSYHNPGIQATMAHIMACADVISTTTTALYYQLKKLNPHTVIVPNAYRSDLFPYRDINHVGDKPIFVWRGTATHDGDLLSVAEALPYLPAKLYVLGSLPYTISRKMKPEQYQCIGHQDNLMYWKFIYDLSPQFFINPLDPCFFNQCKSNIAWMEGLHCGALTIAPELPEWKRLGAISYLPNNPESFLSAVNDAFNMPLEDRKGLAQAAFKQMKEIYDIECVNTIRKALIESLLSSEFVRNKRSPFDQLTAMWAMSVLKGSTLDVDPQVLKDKNLGS